MDIKEPIDQGWVMDNFSFIKISILKIKIEKTMHSLENYFPILEKYFLIHSSIANSSICLSWWL
jgi:hypothetical protein